MNHHAGKQPEEKYTTTCMQELVHIYRYAARNRLHDAIRQTGDLVGGYSAGTSRTGKMIILFSYCRSP
jgi:oligoendopeptidase F